jgi:excisionase family DNA binding protein
MVEKQLDLFNINISTAVVLQKAASNGRLFYTIRQVAKMLGISGFRVYYLVYNYRLDALMVGGEYRIPYTAILDYLSDRCMITRQFFDYLAWIETREISGALPFISGESSVLPRLPEGLLVSTGLARRIRNRILPDPESLATAEDNPIDWYDLADLGLPQCARVATWAGIMQTTVGAIISDSDWYEDSRVDYPEMYDWMVEREVVNLPIPYRFVTPKKSVNPEEGYQLNLFDSQEEIND